MRGKEGGGRVSGLDRHREKREVEAGRRICGVGLEGTSS